MEDLLKTYFVKHKQLIFERLGILSLNTIPAYFDIQNQQLFPTHLNYAFAPEKNLKNDTDFFEIIALRFEISIEQAQQLYHNFVLDLITDFEEKLTFGIPHFFIVRKVNDAYLVEIDSTFQMIFNPISVEKNSVKKVSQKMTTTIIQKQVSLPQKSIYSNTESTIQIPVIEQPQNIAFSNTKQTSKNKTQQKKEIKPTPLLPKKKLNKVETFDKQNTPFMVYLLIAIIVIAIGLIGIKFFISNNNGYLSSLWK